MSAERSPEGKNSGSQKPRSTVLSVLNGIKLHKAVQQENMEKAQKFDDLMAARTTRRGAIRNEHVERITDPNDAEQMHANRETQLCVDYTASCIYAAMHAQTPEEAQNITDQLRLFLEGNGGLFSRYSIEEERARIEHPREYICVRAGAEVFSNTKQQWYPFQYTSEMRTRLADIDPEAPLITPIPDPNSDCFNDALNSEEDKGVGQRIAAEIHKNHSSIVEVQDIYTFVREAQDYGIASLARNETDRIIEEVENPLRPEHAQIKYIIANIFSLKGMRTTSDPHKELKDMPLSPITNMRSYRMHMLTQNSRFKAVSGWSVPPTPMPITFQPEDSQDLVDAELDLGWQAVVFERLRP